MVPCSLLTCNPRPTETVKSPSTLIDFNALQIRTADVYTAYSILNNGVGLSSLIQLLEDT